MATGGSLSALQMIAGVGMLENTALEVNSQLNENLDDYNAIPVVNQLDNVITAATGVLSDSVLDSLRTMGQDFVALTNAIPSAYVTSLQLVAPGGIYDGGFSGLINNMASGIMGDGDLSQFTQIWTSTNGYIGQANLFINCALNITKAIGQTFGPINGGMDNVVTAGFNQTNQAFGAFGLDLKNLGRLIDMNNLPNLGVPSALLKQIITVGGLTPAVERLLTQAGLTESQLADFVSGTFTDFADTANKLIYEGMTKITGQELVQVKQILKITTPNINTMADLLNPLKIFPTSYPSLTMPTPDGIRAIYATIGGAVNTSLEKFLIDSNVPIYAGDDAIVKARLDAPSVGRGSDI